METGLHLQRVRGLRRACECTKRCDTQPILYLARRDAHHRTVAPLKYMRSPLPLTLKRTLTAQALASRSFGGSYAPFDYTVRSPLPVY
ncbi:unnamed protein product [Colias eurytheme]|nr:unnamed protein product [Colias eurytheme]